MFNYIRAELYRNFNRKYFWAVTLWLALMAVAGNILGKVNNLQGMNLSLIFEMTLFVLGFPAYLVAVFVDMVTAEENKNVTLRNIITFGVSRYKIILSKFTVTVILAFLSAIIIFGSFFGSGLLLFGVDPGVSKAFPMVLERLLTAVPLWIGAISVGSFLAIAIKNSTLFGFAHIGIFLMTSNIIVLLSYLVSDKFRYIDKYLITTRLAGLRAEQVPGSELWLSAAIGIGYTVVFTALSILYFSKKEVK